MDCRSEIEEWRAIPGYEGLYEASNLGRIRTAFGKTTASARFPVRVWKQRVLKPKVQTRSSGRKDERVSLWKNGEENTLLVARLVAMSFLPLPEEKLTVNHINGNSMDNRVENLEWCTIGDNIRHAFETGLQKNCQKAVTLEGIDGKILQFASMSEASRYLGRNTGYVSAAIANACCCFDKLGNKFYPSLVRGEET